MATHVRDLATLQDLARQQGLIEHISDSRTVHISNYPTAVTISGTGSVAGPSADIALDPGEEATLAFGDDVQAIGFTYQQGLYQSAIRVELADGQTFDYTGEGFMPATRFFGFNAPDQAIRSLTLRPRETGNLEVHEFYFYARTEHPRQFPPG